MKSISVALFDDDQEELDSAKDALIRIFEDRDVAVDVHSFRIDSWTNENARDFTSLRPEIAIFDNHVGDDPFQEMFGQEVIAKLKPIYPDCVFALLTKVDIKAHSLPNKIPHPDVILQKHHLEIRAENYSNWVFSELTNRTQRAMISEIDTTQVEKLLGGLRATDHRNKRRAIKDKEVISLVEQVCYTGGGPHENLIDGVRLEPLFGGRSDAVVTLMSAKNRFGEFQVPSVLKIMRRQAADREAHNHAKYVKWVLPYRWRVDVIGKGFTADFGAVCYSFAHAGGGKPETLDSLVSTGQYGRVRAVVGQIFDPDNRVWYSQKRPQDDDQVSLVAYLGSCAPYFTPNIDEIVREREVRDYISQISRFEGVELLGDEASGRVRIGEYDFASGSLISQYLAVRDVGRAEICLSHGDLNGSNILVQEGQTEFCFIDFQHTGWHHRSRDFCSLEASIRLNLPEAVTVAFPELVARDVSAWERFSVEQFDLHNDGDVVDFLRSLYVKNHKGSALEYAMCSFAHTLWLLSLKAKDPSIWSNLQERRLLAFLFATWIVIHGKLVTV